jgi:hypothetical protein
VTCFLEKNGIDVNDSDARWITHGPGDGTGHTTGTGMSGRQGSIEEGKYSWLLRRNEQGLDSPMVQGTCTSSVCIESIYEMLGP